MDKDTLEKIKRACSPQKAVFELGNYVESEIVPTIEDATNTANSATAQANSAYNRATEAINIASGVQENVNRSLIDLNTGGDASTVSLSAPRNTGNPATAILPVADSTRAGVMNSATYVNLQNLNTRVTSLEGQTTSYIVSFTNDDPTQDEVNNAYKTAYPLAPFPPIDGTTVIDANRQLYYRWIKNGSVWIKTTGFVISQFTNETAGIIKGSTTEGQIQAETDGTGSLVGYDALKSGVAGNATGISTLTTNLNNLSSTVNQVSENVTNLGMRADNAVTDINFESSSENATLKYTDLGGLNWDENLPIASNSQCGIITPTMFNAWNNPGGGVTSTYLKGDSAEKEISPGITLKMSVGSRTIKINETGNILGFVTGPTSSGNTETKVNTGSTSLTLTASGTTARYWSFRILSANINALVTIIGRSDFPASVPVIVDRYD